MKMLAANELQDRFNEIALPEELMVDLQITAHDLGWDAAAQANRERFLEQGYILVVDRSASPARTYFISPQRQCLGLNDGSRH
jgi:hypothetical protein